MRAIKYRIPKGYHTSNETFLSLLQTFNKSHLSFNYSHYTDQFKAENSFFFCKRIEKDIMSKIKSVSNSKRIEFMYSSNFKNKHDTFKSNMERKKTQKRCNWTELKVTKNTVAKIHDIYNYMSQLPIQHSTYTMDSQIHVVQEVLQNLL